MRVEVEKIHTLYIVHPKSATHAIAERECRIIVKDNTTWAEPLMPLRGSARSQKLFLIGAFAFYTRKQAERRKLMQLVELSKLYHVRNVMQLASEAQAQLQHYKDTGEVK